MHNQLAEVVSDQPDAPLPLVRITRRVETRDDDHLASVHLVENTVREAVQQDAADLLVQDLIMQRCATEDRNRNTELRKKLPPKPFLLGFVPLGCLGDLRLGIGPKDQAVEPGCQPSERSIRSSASSRGMAAPGLRRYASERLCRMVR